MYTSLFYFIVILVGYFIISYFFYCFSSFILVQFSLNDYISFSLTLDDLSISCLIMLVVCSLSVLPYLDHYSPTSSFFSLQYLVISFIMFMSVLILSGSLFTSLVGWELLGTVSVLLILYNCTFSSARSCCVTLISSRFGDVALFLLVAFEHNYFGNYNTLCLLYLLVVMTKSAIFPITSWLLEAMRAPTPVSCLVHSSTLVAAGVWFSLRFNIQEYDVAVAIFIILSMLSVSLTACFAILNMDLKNIVALSTCNNISWSVLSYVLGDSELSLIFLVGHGVGKCLLFISSGDIFTSSSHSQFVCSLSSLRYMGYFSSSLFVLLVCSLSGFPFIGIFCAKHLFCSSCWMLGNFALCIWIFFNIGLTFIYSYRLAFKILGLAFGNTAVSARSFSLCYFAGILPSIIELISSWDFDECVVVYDLCPYLNLLLILLHFTGFGIALGVYREEYPLSSLVYYYCYSLLGCSSVLNHIMSFSYMLFRYLHVFSINWEYWVLYNIGCWSRSFLSNSLYLIDINLVSAGLIMVMLFCFIYGDYSL